MPILMIVVALLLGGLSGLAWGGAVDQMRDKAKVGVIRVLGGMSLVLNCFSVLMAAAAGYMWGRG